MHSFITRLIIRPYKSKRLPDKEVAIIVPLSDRPDFTSDEEISLRHLSKYLGDYDKYLIVPNGMDINVNGCKLKHFPKHYFGSAAAHGRLLFAPFFYKEFCNYKYVLFYHLDALVFSDQLKKWCASGLDYIGAPWLKCSDTPWVKEEQVGNGGFALLKIESALMVLNERYRQKPRTFWLDFSSRQLAKSPLLVSIIYKLNKYFPRSNIIQSIAYDWEATEHPSEFYRQNDWFWSREAVKFMPSFRVASVDEGLKFAFEAAPKLCFQRANQEIPFGCHAWSRYDREFWEQYLIK